jgi:hypothetical protein
VSGGRDSASRRTRAPASVRSGAPTRRRRVLRAASYGRRDGAGGPTPSNEGFLGVARKFSAGPTVYPDVMLALEL